MAEILVIDDEQDVCQVLKEALEYEGFSAETVTHGDRAVQAVLEKPYRLLVVDIKLGGTMTGIDVIKSCRLAQKQPKIIVISAVSKKILLPQFHQEGIADLVDEILEKPSDLHAEKFIKAVKRVLQEDRQDTHE